MRSYFDSTPLYVSQKQNTNTNIKSLPLMRTGVFVELTPPVAMSMSVSSKNP